MTDAVNMRTQFEAGLKFADLPVPEIIVGTLGKKFSG